MTAVRGCVYVYTDSKGLTVYVGQTRQLPAMRDKAHRRDTVTPFDRSYDEDGKYIMRVIENKAVEFANAVDEQIAISVVCDWMDTMEMKYIDEYNTQGWQFRYIDESREPVRRAKAKGEALKKRVRCESDMGHKEFQSIKGAADFLRRNASTVYDAIKKQRRINGFAVEYMES